ncbi:unnamed protein product [Brachionus calyciflorus]|uniref:Integrase catalytic domain-containing protein n=1 Tax=Brachionus calyciflorus TaxID=104777 RepID=A0A814MUY3_9BILA|nr:unnamed protein product [Brachionus calyciflorus]
MELFAIPNAKALTVAKCFLTFISRHGIPEAILTDQGTNYQSALIEGLWNLMDIKRLRTTPIHLQTDGISERLNRTVKRIITCFINEIHDNWDEDLNLLSLAYNTAVHSTTKYSPYELMYGRKPKMPLDLIYRHPVINVRVTQGEYAGQIQQSLLKAFEKVKRNREIRIRKIKLNYDRNVVAAKFKPGDLVWVHNDVIKKGQCKKFTYSWNGPYVVEQELNKDQKEVSEDENLKGDPTFEPTIRVKKKAVIVPMANNRLDAIGKRVRKKPERLNYGQK